jgi:tRNA threonylcarbamoyladenosine biosynthesis protein TsaB
MPAIHLLLETSGRAGRVGVAVDDGIVAMAQLDEARRHARDLASTIERLLGEAGGTAKDLAGIAVSIGPGSFTGLRVGITTAKALAYAVGCPLVAVPTFLPIARQAAFETVDVISDGLQKHVYCQRFVHGVPASDLRIRPVEFWIASLSPTVAVSGPAVAMFDAVIPAECPRVEESLRMPTVEKLFAASRTIAPLTLDELFTLEPLYLRGSSAEEAASKNR